MKIKFNKVIIDNFLSFGHAEIDLRDRGYTLVEGINNSPKDGAKSNGSGKSSIFSAVCYALTGETIQGLTSNLNNIITNGDMSVELDFNVDADNFVLVRSRDTKNHADLKVIVNGVDKSGKGVRESQEILEKYLPELNSDLIGEVIIVGQGMPHKFSNNTPSGRKDLLERLSHSDYMLEDIRDRVERRSSELKEKANTISLNKAKKESEKSFIEQNLRDKELELKGYDNKPDFESQIKTLESKNQEDEKSLNTLNKDLTDKTNLLEKVNQDILNLTNEKSKLLEEELKTFNEHNLSIKMSISDKRNLVRTLNEEITKIKNIKDTCPTCGQKIPHVHKQDTTQQEEQVRVLTEEINALVQKDSNQETAYRLNTEDIKNSFKTKEETLNKQKVDLRTETETIRGKVTVLNSTITDNKLKITKITQERDSFDKQKNKCIEDIERLKTQLTAVNNEILYIIKEDEEVEKHQEVINKMSTLIKRDFRGILLSSIIKYIDSKCKLYAKDIFGTDNLEFKLDGNNIDITYLNKPLEALSGGEQQKVDLILQFAIRSMMQEYTGFTSNIIVLDEILDNLDSVGCDSVLNFITNKLSDIESIFIISHHADTLNIGNDSTITVVKNTDGVSYIL